MKRNKLAAAEKRPASIGTIKPSCFKWVSPILMERMAIKTIKDVAAPRIPAINQRHVFFTGKGFLLNITLHP
jgi:hypothetical protein